YQRDETVGSHYITGGNVLLVRPCLQESASVCDLSRAPFWMNANGETRQVFFEHDVLAAGAASDPTILSAAPFDIPIRRLSACLQDQWRVLPSLTVNVGLRYDTERYEGYDPVTGPFRAFSLTDQWAPRLGVAWDFAGDGTSKLYGSVGRFYY